MSLRDKFSPYKGPPRLPQPPPQIPRFLGLSKNQRGVPPLLSRVGSVNRRDAKPTETNDVKPLQTKDAQSTERREVKAAGKRDGDKIINKRLATVAMVADDAPPLSSEDEGSSQGDIQKTNLRSDDPLLSSSDDEGPRRADIHKTNFRSDKKPSSPQVATKLPKRKATQGTRASARAISSQSSQASSSASGKFSYGEEDPDELEEPSRKRKSPDTTELGGHFGRDPIFATSKRGGVGYGKTYRSIKIPKNHDTRKEEVSPKRPVKGLPRDLLKEREDSTSPRKAFVPPPGMGSSPARGSPENKRMKRSLGREKLKVESPEEERPKFIIPALYSDSFDMKDEEDDVFKDHDAFELTRVKEVSMISSPKSSKPVCPMCDEEVEEEIRERFDAKHPGSGFNLRREQLFCLFHKRSSARKMWRARGYPKINWKKLDKRISKQHDFLQAILEGGQSYYGDIFNNSVKSGQNRTLLKSDRNMTPGYYGIRGLRAMTDNLTYKFSRLIRERAVQDRLISARGSVAYVQSVLVPELAVQLIKDDMSVSEEEARSIMEESSAIGELLHEEVKDIVQESAEE